MTIVLMTVVASVMVLTLADIRVQRLRAAGHIQPRASHLEVIWLAFVAPVLAVLWAGLYEMIRTMARGRRQKPPFGAFLTAWVTGKAQAITKRIRVQAAGKERQIPVTEWVRPPRPPGRPRKYPEGWQAARRTGHREVGRARCSRLTSAICARNDQRSRHAIRGRLCRHRRCRGGALDIAQVAQCRGGAVLPSGIADGIPTCYGSVHCRQRPACTPASGAELGAA